MNDVTRGKNLSDVSVGVILQGLGPDEPEARQYRLLRVIPNRYDT